MTLPRPLSKAQIYALGRLAEGMRESSSTSTTGPWIHGMTAFSLERRGLARRLPGTNVYEITGAGREELERIRGGGR